MDIRPGDAVLVNVAAFTGSRTPRPESIPCHAVVVGENEIEIRTQSPYRIFNLVVARSWVGSVECPIASERGPLSDTTPRPPRSGSLHLSS